MYYHRSQLYEAMQIIDGQTRLSQYQNKQFFVTRRVVSISSIICGLLGEGWLFQHIHRRLLAVPFQSCLRYFEDFQDFSNLDTINYRCARHKIILRQSCHYSNYLNRPTWIQVLQFMARISLSFVGISALLNLILQVHILAFQLCYPCRVHMVMAYRLFHLLCKNLELHCIQCNFTISHAKCPSI